MSRHLLVMPCSARKLTAPGLLPARVRYDGSSWRTLRRNWRNVEHLVDLVVLSAEHGFILGDTPIPDYYRKLDKRRALDIVLDISAPWLADRARDTEGRIFLMGSVLYRSTMVQAIGPAFVERRRAAGRLAWPVSHGEHEPGIGEQLAELKRFLRSIRETI